MGRACPQPAPAGVPDANAYALQAPGLGIDSIASTFVDFGYRQQPDQLTFPEKKLIARWYAPPDYEVNLPRLFVSEIQVSLLCTARLTAAPVFPKTSQLLTAACCALPCI